jgi:hypothetical protein
MNRGRLAEGNSSQAVSMKSINSAQHDAVLLMEPGVTRSTVVVTCTRETRNNRTYIREVGASAPTFLGRALKELS